MKCRLCQKTLKDTRRQRCGTCNTKIRRFRSKLAAIMYLGGECRRCSFTLASDYSNIAAFEFHHIRGKDFTIGNVANKSWTVIVRELKKCELLCPNCHRIDHDTRHDPRVIEEVRQYAGSLLKWPGSSVGRALD